MLIGEGRGISENCGHECDITFIIDLTRKREILGEIVQATCKSEFLYNRNIISGLVRLSLEKGTGFQGLFLINAHKANILIRCKYIARKYKGGN